MLSAGADNLTDAFRSAVFPHTGNVRALTECNGGWIGWWIQGDLRGHQRMSLSFSHGGEIIGSGSDDSGEFDVSGEFEHSDVVLVKDYKAWDVRYFGTWDGSMISGRWTITSDGFYDAGTFEIWPEVESIELNVESLTAETSIPS